MKKKIFLPVVLALLLALCACGQPETTTAPTTTASETTTVSTQLPDAPASEHVDADGDYYCDDCGIYVLVTLDFYAINDLHGVFCDTATNPGVDEMTTYFKALYADDSAYEILLSSGDMWQGSVESSSNQGALMTEWMNEMGFVSMTLGNHEYDWGSGVIAENAALANFPFLGINVSDSNVDAPYCQSSVIVERGGVKIGIIGAVGNWISSISGEFTDGLDFTTGSALTEMVKAEAVSLREQGCQLVVYSIHYGTENSYSGIKDVTSKLAYYDQELSNGYIDLVFEAHTHYSYILRDQYGVYHLQTGSYNSGISYASVCYNIATNTYEVGTVSHLSNSVYSDDSLEDDPIVEELYSKYFPDEDPYSTVLGSNFTARNSHDIAVTVAQLYLEKGRELWGEEYDIVLGGGYIKTRTPYSLTAGDVTYSQLYSLLPFDNSLVLCQVTGQQLKSKLINNSSYTCAYDEGLADTIVDDQLYYVVTDTYTSFYKNNQFTEVARLEGYYARDLLADYIATGAWSGGEAQPITIAQANAIGGELEDNASTTEIYQLTGTITSVVNTTYGNVYIQDENGDSIYLYGLYDSQGRRYDAMENPPQVGDTITVTGTITKYINKQGEAVIEIASALWVEE